MIDPFITAYLYCALITLVIAFQFGLILGAPWGEWAMGGIYPGKFPPAMRVSALAQAVLLALFAAIVLTRAGIAFVDYFPHSRWAIWIVVAISVISAVLNTITPSKKERRLWAPVTVILLLCALRVALS